MINAIVCIPYLELKEPYERCIRQYSDSDIRFDVRHIIGIREALEDVLSDKSVGIVLLTEKFGREFPDIIDTFRLERKMPLLVEIPDRHGTGRKKDFITSYITEAIGLKL